MKRIAIFIITFGLIFIGIGGYQLVKTKIDQNQALEDAKSILTMSKSKEIQYKDGMDRMDTFPSDFSPSNGETVGILHIPKLEADLPIVEGTDPDELAIGVGHYKRTAYPLQQDQIVLSGHRETVFRRMGELELGDILTVKLPYGEFSYEIVNTEVVPEDDQTVIGTTFPNETLTLTTCYPFSFIGNAPDRYIITAHPITKN